MNARFQVEKRKFKHLVNWTHLVRDTKTRHVLCISTDYLCEMIAEVFNKNTHPNERLT